MPPLVQLVALLEQQELKTAEFLLFFFEKTGLMPRFFHLPVYSSTCCLKLSH